MLSSVRVRLTLWYTGVLALVLVLFGAITYFIFWRSTIQRTDSDLAQLADAFLITFQDEFKDLPASGDIRPAAREAILEHRFREHVFVFVDAPGNKIISSDEVSSPGAPANTPESASQEKLLASDAFQEFVQAARSSNTAFQTVPGSPYGYRGFACHLEAGGTPYTLFVLRSLRPQEELFEKIRETFAWAIPLGLLMAMSGGYFLAWKSLAPIVAMSTQAAHIGAANLHQRLAIHNAKDELGHLGKSFNDLLDRLSASFEQQRRFMADASHELRTPVAILRGEAEVSLSRATRSEEDYRESLTIVHNEATRLSRIVEDLFTLARADAGQHPLVRREFYLDELVAEVMHSARALASEKHIALTAKASEECTFVGDEGLIRRMLMNLVSNGIKYTPPGGHVTLGCSAVNDHYALTVSDTGPGIPPAIQKQVFERFFRGDAARSREPGQHVGAGLGLAIARWIAEAHQGSLELARSDTSGSVFLVSLPLTKS
jgi:heavy metal sensor kinase